MMMSQKQNQLPDLNAVPLLLTLRDGYRIQCRTRSSV